jgi:hypothetical protein
METTKNNMPDAAKVFFNRLQNYLDLKVYYYGSIQRYDYFPESSDIDAAIFTDNIESTIIKLQTFLNENRGNFKKFVYKLHQSDKVVYGYKIKYVPNNKDFIAELAIYNENVKTYVLKELNFKNNIPFYVSFILYFLKFLYYNIKIIPFNTYYFLKKACLNYLVEGKDTEYAIIG